MVLLNPQKALLCMLPQIAIGMNIFMDETVNYSSTFLKGLEIGIGIRCNCFPLFKSC